MTSQSAIVPLFTVAVAGCLALPHGTAPPYSDLDLICKMPIDDIRIKKTDPSHNDCCCNKSSDLPECQSYNKSTHFCVEGELRSLKPFLGFLSTKQPDLRTSVPLHCEGQIFRSDLMSCDNSTGELVLHPFFKFRSLSLCKNLPSTPETKSPLRLQDKDVYVEGRVNVVEVDISANYLFIDLLPFNFSTSSDLPESCRVEGRQHMRVKVRLPDDQECTALGEVQKRLYSRTLYIWFESRAGQCGGNRRVMTLSIPKESRHLWMMVSQRSYW